MSEQPAAYVTTNTACSTAVPTPADRLRRAHIDLLYAMRACESAGGRQLIEAAINNIVAARAALGEWG